MNPEKTHIYHKKVLRESPKKRICSYSIEDILREKFKVPLEIQEKIYRCEHEMKMRKLIHEMRMTDEWWLHRYFIDNEDKYLEQFYMFPNYIPMIPVSFLKCGIRGSFHSFIIKIMSHNIFCMKAFSVTEDKFVGIIGSIHTFTKLVEMYLKVVALEKEAFLKEAQ